MSYKADFGHENDVLSKKNSYFRGAICLEIKELAWSDPEPEQATGKLYNFNVLRSIAALTWSWQTICTKLTWTFRSNWSKLRPNNRLTNRSDLRGDHPLIS